MGQSSIPGCCCRRFGSRKAGRRALRGAALLPPLVPPCSVLRCSKMLVLPSGATLGASSITPPPPSSCDAAAGPRGSSYKGPDSSTAAGRPRPSGAAAAYGPGRRAQGASAGGGAPGVPAAARAPCTAKAAAAGTCGFAPGSCAASEPQRAHEAAPRGPGPLHHRPPARGEPVPPSLPPSIRSRLPCRPHSSRHSSPAGACRI